MSYDEHKKDKVDIAKSSYFGNLILKKLIECPKCKGKGYLIIKSKLSFDSCLKMGIDRFKRVCCNKCKGKGFIYGN